MSNQWITLLAEHYNWQASLIALASIIAITKAGKWLVFKVPALSEMRNINTEKDKEKWRKEKYPPVVRATQKMGMFCNAAFFLLVLPFCITTEAQSVWNIALDIFIILMFYDFFYYLSHRFWFHGNGAMRQIHAIHHQARSPTYLDSHYVHPTETFIGLALYIGSIAFLSLILGPFHLITMALTFVIYVQINTINHTFVNLPYFPFKTLSWITAKHHVHHENMHKGNYATITLFYDKLFGTLD